MDLQQIIVGIILIAVVLAAVTMFIRKSKSLVPGPHCENDCGCSGSKKAKGLH